MSELALFFMLGILLNGAVMDKAIERIAALAIPLAMVPFLLITIEGIALIKGGEK